MSLSDPRIELVKDVGGVGDPMNIQILKTAEMGEIHQPMPLTPVQKQIVRAATSLDQLRDDLITTGLRDFVIIRDDTPGSDLTPEQIATKIGVSLEEYLSVAQVSPKCPPKS
jgi:hypothetical protein